MRSWMYIIPLSNKYKKKDVLFASSREEHPTSCSSRKVFLMNFHLAGRFFVAADWKNLRNTLILCLCEKSRFYNWQMVRFTHKLHLCVYNADIIVVKSVPFLRQMQRDRNSSAGWQKEGNLFKKITFSNVFIFMISIQYVCFFFA